MKKIFYVEPTGGLCNRIGVLNYCYHMAEQCGYNVVLIWKNNTEAACRYQDVFEASGVKVINMHYSVASIKELLKKGKILSCIGWLIERGIWGLVHLILYSHEFVMLDGDDMPRVEADARNKENIEKIKWNWFFASTYQCADIEYDYSRVKFREVYHRKAEQILGNDIGSVIGVHIRRTDHSYAIDANPLDIFIEKMHREQSQNCNVKFYVASDDAKVINQLMKEFPEKILINKGAELSRKSKVGMENAVVDLMALSKTNKIIGSKGSTFSDVASFIGKIPLEYASDN